MMMKKQTIDTVSLAALARLELTAAEHERMTRELEEFADFAALLSSLDGMPHLDGCEPLEDRHIREDIAVRAGARIVDGYVTVPLTVEADL